MNKSKHDLKTLLNRYIDQEKKYCDPAQNKLPSFFFTLWLLSRVFSKILARIYHKIFYLDQWYLMFGFDDDLSMSFRQYKKVTPPKDRFWADPQVIHVDGCYYVFIEEFLYKAKKAHISVICLEEQGNFSEPMRVLEEDYHLSYPFVVKWEGNYYMVPESAENKTISLYECINFPTSWRFRLNLIENVSAVDTTLFYYQRKWWLFTGMPAQGNTLPFCELHLFFSNSLITNKWQSHPQNPIISDVEKARPAGRLFVRNGRIFRPSQNSTKTYGYGFYLNEVLRLSESEYDEKTVISVIPDWDSKLKATHTFTKEDRLTVIDAFTRRRKLL